MYLPYDVVELVGGPHDGLTLVKGIEGFLEGVYDDRISFGLENCVYKSIGVIDRVLKLRVQEINSDDRSND